MFTKKAGMRPVIAAVFVAPILAAGAGAAGAIGHLSSTSSAPAASVAFLPSCDVPPCPPGIEPNPQPPADQDQDQDTDNG